MKKLLLNLFFIFAIISYAKAHVFQSTVGGFAGPRLNPTLFHLNPAAIAWRKKGSYGFNVIRSISKQKYNTYSVEQYQEKEVTNIYTVLSEFLEKNPIQFKKLNGGVEIMSYKDHVSALYPDGSKVTFYEVNATEQALGINLSNLAFGVNQGSVIEREDFVIPEENMSLSHSIKQKLKYEVNGYSLKLNKIFLGHTIQNIENSSFSGISKNNQITFDYPSVKFTTIINAIAYHKEDSFKIEFYEITQENKDITFKATSQGSTSSDVIRLIPKEKTSGFDLEFTTYSNFYLKYFTDFFNYKLNYYRICYDSGSEDFGSFEIKNDNLFLETSLQFSEVLISVGLMQVDRKQYNLPSNELIWSLEQRGLSLGISGEF